MNLPPMLMYLRIVKPGQAPVSVWLPLFLLWPLVALVLLLPVLVLMIVDAALLVAGQRYHHYSLLVLRALALIGDTRGMVIRVKDGRTDVDVTLV